MFPAPKAHPLARLAFLLLLAIPVTAGGEPLFEAATTYPVGIAPYAIDTGDLNGDGLADIVTGNNFGGVSILLGAEDGTFESKPPVELFDTVFNIALGHLDGDGDLDLVVGMFASVAVMMGDGKGGFEEPTYFPADYAPAVTIGDFNGDGFSDFAFSNWNINTITLMAGGDGKFEIMATLTLDGGAQDIAAGDLDGDGKADLAAVIFESQTASVYRSSNGFSERAIYPVGGHPNDVVIGDATGDGRPDVVVACFGSGWVAVLPNDSSGELKPAARWETGDFPGSVVIGDLNHDEIPDLVTTNESDTQTLSVLLGTGTGAFQDKIDTPVGTVVHDIVMGDFDGDEHADVVTAALSNDMVVAFRGHGDGRFTTRETQGVGQEPRSVAIVDLDRDTHMDLVTANDVGNSITVLIQRGEGWARTDYAAPLGPMAIAAGDLNGDGNQDVVSVSWRGNAASVFLGNGDGTLRPRTDYPMFGSGFSVAIADLNGDGRLDLAVGIRAGDGVFVLLGRGDGTFPPGAVYGTSGPGYGVAVGDVNGDGKVDIATASYDGGVTVLRGNGNGVFSLLSVTPVFGSPRGIAMSDLNKDGKEDLITANVASSTVSVLMGNGAGAFSVTSLPAGSNATSIAVADLTGEGYLDFAVANTGGTTVSFFSGRGDGTFQPRIDYQASRNPHCVAIGDMNGDHLPDLVTADVTALSISILPHANVGDIIVVGVEPVSERGVPAPRIFPNPLNPSGALMYRTARPGPVDLRVFDVHGRLVRTISVPLAGIGSHELEIDGQDASGGPLASGVYYYSLHTADGIARGRFALLK